MTKCFNPIIEEDKNHNPPTNYSFSIKEINSELKTQPNNSIVCAI